MTPPGTKAFAELRLKGVEPMLAAKGLLDFC